MTVEKCKGTRDLSPREMRVFRTIEDSFRDRCLKWGYEEVRTPTLEYLYLFTAAGTLTPARLSRVYSFLDWDGWSGERVVLRPDSTIPIARYYIETNNGRSPARLFYVTNVFSFEETGRETREKWQCGAELIGDGSSVSEAELIVLAMDVLGKLGVDRVELKLSHAGLIRGILGKFEADSREQHRLVDSFLDGDTRALAAARPELARVLSPILESRGKTAGFLRNIFVMLGKDLPELERPLNEFVNLASILDTLGVAYEIDISSGRGFEYYTGVIFQMSAGGQVVAGGGRYDALIPLLGGSNTPALGFALYADQVMDIMHEQAAVLHERRIRVVPEAGAESIAAAFNAARALHDAGFVAEIFYNRESDDGGNWKWSLETHEAGWRFTLRDRETGSKSELGTLDEVIARLKG